MKAQFWFSVQPGNNPTFSSGNPYSISAKFNPAQVFIKAWREKSFKKRQISRIRHAQSSKDSSTKRSNFDQYRSLNGI